MAFTYVAATAATRAHDYLRFRVGAVKSDASPAVDDGEVLACLTQYGLVADSAVSDTNRTALLKAAAALARSIAGGYGRQGSIVVSEVGPPKNATAEFYLKLAKDLEGELKAAIDLQVAAQEADQLVPAEEVDTMDYRVGHDGKDRSEYVGDETL